MERKDSLLGIFAKVTIYFSFTSPVIRRFRNRAFLIIVSSKCVQGIEYLFVRTNIKR
jgi:hypothetical protein